MGRKRNDADAMEPPRTGPNYGVDTPLLKDMTYFVIEKDGEIAGCGGWSKHKTLFGGSQFSDREASWGGVFWS